VFRCALFDYHKSECPVSTSKKIRSPRFPPDELDVLWNRFVGIVPGVVAMRLALAFPTLSSRQESPDSEAAELDVEGSHRRAI
jgi:hypothetical protein